MSSAAVGGGLCTPLKDQASRAGTTTTERLLFSPWQVHVEPHYFVFPSITTPPGQ